MSLKLSGFPTNSTPSLTDTILSIKTPGTTPQDVQITLQALVNLINKTSLLANPYKFSVYRAASQASYMVTSGTYYTAQFDTASYDTGSNYNTGTYTFTAPVAGFYFLSARVSIQNGSNATFANIRLVKNGNTTTPLDLNQGQTSAPQGSPGLNVGGQVYQLAAGDTITVQTACGINNIGINGGANTTWFSGYLVSAT